MECQATVDNRDLKQPWTAIPRRSTGSQDCLVDRNLHNSQAVHLTSRRSFPPVWRCLENVSLVLNVNFEIRVFSKPNLDYILKYRYKVSHKQKLLIFSFFFPVQKRKFTATMANPGSEVQWVNISFLFMAFTSAFPEMYPIFRTKLIGLFR